MQADKQPARTLSDAALRDILAAASRRFLTAVEVYRLLHSFRRQLLHLPGSPCGGVRTAPPPSPPPAPFSFTPLAPACAATGMRMKSACTRASSSPASST